jgi:hypothetical protein
MSHSTLNERLRVYISTTTKSLLWLAWSCLSGSLIALINTRIGVGVFILSLPLLFGTFHWNIARTLIPQDKKPFLYALPVIVTAALLLSFKVAVNVTLNTNCLDRIPETTILLNFISYSLWTGVLLWEVFLSIILRHTLTLR